MNQRLLRTIAAGCLAAAMLARGVWAEDWPAYKKDAARTSVTAEEVGRKRQL